MASGRWELVDGQQRLTTLYLILRIIKQFLPQYETPLHADLLRPDPGAGHHLDDLQAAASVQNIDYSHMYRAFTVVQAWFEEQPDSNLAAIDLYAGR